MSKESVDEEEKVGVEELEGDQLGPKKDVVLGLRRDTMALGFGVYSTFA